MEIDRVPPSPTDLSDVIDSTGWWQIGGVMMGNDMSLKGEAQRVSVQVCAHASPWMQVFALSNAEPIHCASQKGLNTRPHISLHLLSVDIKAGISERLKLPLPTTCFASSFYHTTHEFLSSRHHASACFWNHLQSSFSPMKLLEFVHLISTLTYPTCCAGGYVKLMKYIGSPTRHVRTHRRTRTHTQWHVYLHTLGTPSDS